MNCTRISLNIAVLISTALLLVGAAAARADDSTGDRTCSHWAQLAGSDHSNAEPADLGCTNRRNLEHMVEAPLDLERGRSLGPADAEREAHAVKIYEEGKVQFIGSSAGPAGFVLGPATPTQGTQ